MKLSATQTVFLLAASALVVGLSSAQDLYVYPAQGQSAEQQEQDKFQCYEYARKTTGFDPMQTPQASAPPPATEAPQGGAAAGAVKGGVGGALIGAIAGNTKKGAAIGAATGGLLGGVRRSEQKTREENARRQWEQDQVGQYSQNRSNYNRAYSACLEGRGYTVK